NVLALPRGPNRPPPRRGRDQPARVETAAEVGCPRPPRRPERPGVPQRLRNRQGGERAPFLPSDAFRGGLRGPGRHRGGNRRSVREQPRREVPGNLPRRGKAGGRVTPGTARGEPAPGLALRHVLPAAFLRPPGDADSPGDGRPGPVLHALVDGRPT